jgi:hypothetical protein
MTPLAWCGGDTYVLRQDGYHDQGVELKGVAGIPTAQLTFGMALHILE